MKSDKPSLTFVSAHSPDRAWTIPSTMPSVFTAFVRSQQGEETPDADLFHDAWNSLQAALGSELKRRGLWRSPPCYLGVYGYERWDAEETTGDPMAQAWGDTQVMQSALAELVSDCWAYIFSDRRRSLKQQLAAKANIDGLVCLNIKHFLHERQREHDPVGYRIFERVKGAVQETVSRGSLWVLAGDKRIRNSTVLGFEPGRAPRLPAKDLGPIVACWNDQLLPDLVTARGREEAAILERLRRLLVELPAQGIHSFRFKDLVDPLKSDARGRWAAFLAGEVTGRVERSGDEVQLRRQALPECAFESRQSYEHLTSCVSTAIRRMEADPRTRGYLAALWNYLQLQYGDERGEAAGEEDALVAEGPLSHRQLSQRLQIPRDRMPSLFASLRQLVTRCRLAGTARLGRRAAAGTAPARLRESQS
jgi:hypothetical protein